MFSLTLRYVRYALATLTTLGHFSAGRARPVVPRPAECIERAARRIA